MNQPRRARFLLVQGLDRDVVYKFQSIGHRDKWVAENLWAIEGHYQNLTARQVDKTLSFNKDTIYRTLQENPND
jgi:hypothetical protein